MKSPRSRFPLQILTLIVLPSMLLVLLVAIGGVALHQSAMRDMIVDHNLHAVRGAAASLSQQVEERQDVLAGLAQRVQENLSYDGAVAHVDDWGTALFSKGVTLYNSQGEQLTQSSPSPAWADPRIAEAIISGKPQVLSLAESGNTLSPIAILVPDADREIWAVGITSLESLGLSDVLQSLHPEEATVVMLITRDREIVYHSNPQRIGTTIPDTDYSKTLLTGQSGANYVDRGRESEIVSTFARVQNADWVLVQEERWRESLGLLTRYSQAAPLVLVPGLLIAAAAVWFGLRRIVLPLRQLEDQATDLAWGNFESIEKPVGGIEEIGQLQATLRYLASRVRSTQAGMRNYIAAITRTQEDERARLARELHDQTVQSLIALGHREQRLKRLVADNPQALDVLGDLRVMTTQAVDDLRRITRGMRPIYLEELGLAPALEMLARDLDLNERKIAVAFDKSGEPRRLLPDHEMALYRVAQEALSNVWQHSQANQAWLSVSFTDKEVVVSVRDNGQGFAAPQRVTDLSEKGHFGIMGMHERAALIGAYLHIESTPGIGTIIRVRVPFADSSSYESSGGPIQPASFE